MSFCVCCLKNFIPGKTNRKGFCSKECWVRYEKKTASHNCLGVGRMNSKANNLIKNKSFVNFEEQVDVAFGDCLSRPVHERATIKLTNFTPAGKQNIQKFLKWLTEFKIKNNLN